MSDYLRVADALFRELNHGMGLLEWVEVRRLAGTGWRPIAAELEERTRGAVQVSAQTLINWTTKVAA